MGRLRAARGSVHAWVGIIAGGLMTLVWGGLLVMSLLSSLQGY